MEIDEFRFDEAVHEGIWHECGAEKLGSRGKLFIQNKQMYLELENPISIETDHAPNIIYGTTGNNKLTLLNSFLFYRGDCYRYHVKIAIEGAHSLRNSTYSEVKFNIPELVQWFRPSLINFANVSKVNIDLKEPPILVSNSEDKSRRFKFFNKYSFKSLGQSTISPMVQYVLNSKVGLNIYEIRDEIIKLLQALSLLTLKELTITRIWLRGDLRLHISPFTNKDVNKKKVDVPLVEYRWIKEEFPNVLDKFFDIAEKLDPVASLLFQELSRKDKGFNENNFLNIIRAIEVFHRRFIGKEGTLLERLEDLKEKSSITFFEEHISDYSLFLKQLKDSRNYYTHYDKIKQHTAVGEELFRIYHLSKYMIVSYVLEYLECKDMNGVLKKKEANFFRYYN